MLIYHAVSVGYVTSPDSNEKMQNGVKRNNILGIRELCLLYIN